MIKVNLKHSGTKQDDATMSWLLRNMRERALLSTWPKELNPDAVWERARTIYFEGVKASGIREHSVYFIIDPQEGATRPEHPQGREKNFSPSTNYEGWYFQAVPYDDEDDDSVVATQHMNHQIAPGPTDRHVVSYAHLTNADIADLIGCNRLLAFESTPEHLKAKVVPTGTDLIEEIQRRLRNAPTTW